MLRNLAISTFLCAGVVSAAHADVFRWVDDHGGVHYSDQWVPGSEVIKSVDQAASRSGARQPVVLSTEARQDAPAQPRRITLRRLLSRTSTKVREQQCKDAKDRYEKAIQARRIYKSGPSTGNAKDPDHADDRQYLSDEEADAYRVKARQDVQDFCGSAPPTTSGE